MGACERSDGDDARREVPPTVLVVDDEPAVRTAICRMLERANYDSCPASTGADALARIERAPPDVAVIDLQMPGMSGLDLLARMRATGVNVPAVMVSGAGSLQDAVRAVQLGAVDFLEKPVPLDRLREAIAACALRGRVSPAVASSAIDMLVGASQEMQQLRRTISRVAATEGRVLVVGENGTGKELVAAAIHYGSRRAEQPFVKLNCAAVPDQLVESEFFGHEKGAFTGALARRAGRFERAHGGTLFLDEVGDMSLTMQAKLLRVLQEGEVERVGGGSAFHVDVRVVAASNRDLERMVDEGRFREDLYYRLAVVTLRIAPLRERLNDIPRLAVAFAQEIGAREGRRFDIAPEGLAALCRHDYPGNVRELRNVIERLAVLTGSGTATPAHVAEALPRRTRAREASAGLYRPGRRFAALVEDAERRILREALSAHDNNKSAAARALGLERSHFHKKCRLLDVETAS